jgi:epsilon-lactone hydrolase
MSPSAKSFVVEGVDDVSGVEPDGSLRIDGFTLPPSAGWSDEARRVFLKRFAGPAVSAQSIAGRPDADQWLRSAHAFRAGMEQLHRRLLGAVERDHHCDVEESTVGGVRVQRVTPRSGVTPQNAERVLVNLHGGAFVGGAEYCGLVESLPVSDVGGFRICVVDYRQGWEHRFPAASEDVAAVVGELQRTHQPNSIGVFGYSAGGLLTAQAVPRLLAEGIPLPGALAICSAGAGGAGDSTYLANVAMGSPPAAAQGEDSRAALGSSAAPASFGYAEGVDPTNPLFAPIHSADVLAQFPPTLVLTGTRSFDQSGALLTHRALLAAGATAELHAWEGMWHCFPYNHRMPEAKDAFRTIAGFFDRRLA